MKRSEASKPINNRDKGGHHHDTDEKGNLRKRHSLYASRRLFFPDLELPATTQQTIGHYGRIRKAYLEKHRPGLYERLILSGKLYEHLAEIDVCCADRMDRMIHQKADAEGISEEMKARDQLAWVGCMNSVRQRAEEIILNELVYA